MALVQTPQALFVAWQQPKSRRYFPVGRLGLAANADSGGVARYEFAYIKGAHNAAKEGFQPFLAFPDLNRVYRSEDLFPFFANRVMPRSRPDFADGVARLGLDPPTADDMAILARNGGVRATDSIELFPVPVLDTATACYQTWFLAHGLRYLPDSAHERIAMLVRGNRLFILPDVQNPVDSRALALRSDDQIIVGYVPRYLLEDAWQLLEKCGWDVVEVFVDKVNLPPAPLQQRLLCRMKSCWPDGFVPFAGPTYQPIKAEQKATVEKRSWVSRALRRSAGQ